MEQTPQGLEQADEVKLTALYAEFAEEDQALAESGMTDYAEGLAREDGEP